MVGLLTSLAVGLVACAGQEPRPTALGNKIETFRSAAGQTPSVRLRQPLDRKIRELTEYKNDPEFTRLPPELRD